MITLNKDKIQIKYITGIYKLLDGYPTPLDVLYESCTETIDDSLFSMEKMGNRYDWSENLTQKVSEIENYLTEHNYIQKSGKKFKIINTPWQ